MLIVVITVDVVVAGSVVASCWHKNYLSFCVFFFLWFIFYLYYYIMRNHNTERILHTHSQSHIWHRISLRFRTFVYFTHTDTLTCSLSFHNPIYIYMHSSTVRAHGELWALSYPLSLVFAVRALILLSPLHALQSFSFTSTRVGSMRVQCITIRIYIYLGMYDVVRSKRYNFQFACNDYGNDNDDDEQSQPFKTINVYAHVFRT